MVEVVIIFYSSISDGIGIFIQLSDLFAMVNSAIGSVVFGGSSIRYN